MWPTAIERASLTADQLMSLARDGCVLSPFDKARLSSQELLELHALGQELSSFDRTRLDGTELLTLARRGETLSKFERMRFAPSELMELYKIERGRQMPPTASTSHSSKLIPTESSPRDLIYISYSHKDKDWHRKLRLILDADPALRDHVWDDTKIRPGANFDMEIDKHVARARVMIMLGSEAYFGPNCGAALCETKPALEAHKNGTLELLWFPVGTFLYSASPVGGIMAATGAGAVPLNELRPADQKKALHKVRLAVRRCLGIAEQPARETKTRKLPVGTRNTPKKKSEPLVKTLAKAEGASTPQPPIDFVIITPLEEEREAMLDHLGKPKRLPPSTDDIRVYYPATVPVTFTDGRTGQYTVVVTDLLGMGRVDAANAVGDAVRRWKPKFVLLVGIAGGLAKAGVMVGDVLISDQIADYELQKLTADKTETRWSVHRVSPALLAASRQLRPEDWQPLIREPRPQPGKPKRHTGPICTGDKVVANGLLDEFREIWTKLIGVEMEAGGVASAAFQAASTPGFFMVRGVSDLADPDKDNAQTESWRAYACDVAAAYVEAFLKSGPVVPVSNDQPNEEAISKSKSTGPGFTLAPEEIEIIKAVRAATVEMQFVEYVQCESGDVILAGGKEFSGMQFLSAFHELKVKTLLIPSGHGTFGVNVLKLNDLASTNP